MKIYSLKPVRHGVARTIAIASALAFTSLQLGASSHQDAPLINYDPAANTTDVYSFLSQQGDEKYLTTAVGVYPFEEPGIGPNKYNFDETVLYGIHVATKNISPGNNGKTDVEVGRTTISYYFRFGTQYKNPNTILQSYLGVVTNVDDAAQNLTQRYTVRKYDHRNNRFTFLGIGTVPPNNQGNATPFYNQGDNGENPAREGAASTNALDRYTTQTVFNLEGGYQAFAGQRDDGFYGDIQGIFDLLKLRSPGVDAQQGFNVHMMVLNIPLSELGGDQQVVGVYASTCRKQMSVIRNAAAMNVDTLNDGTPFSLRGYDYRQPSPLAVSNRANIVTGSYLQVGRQGNPLFCEGLVAIVDKDLYNRTTPRTDPILFRKYAESPELATLLNALVFGSNVAIDTNRTDLVGIFIPDVIKTDLSTAPARLTGAFADDSGFSSLSIFGNDVLTSSVQTGFFNNGTVPGGWPNGRRFGDDVVDIVVTALASDLRNPAAPIINGPYGDNVNNNDITYNKVFPYAATPLNGRKHTHH